ncbi:DNA (cytosine-5)-methyltransferase 3B-like [Diachasmimorpha longicaudata]|uniref:DNA (cytosine-5)-methyltransferase 3B-like n=1 Tax=Diachasmimorpha longicaudata TaxID=58733 RepID=UPI0030B8CB40
MEIPQGVSNSRRSRKTQAWLDEHGDKGDDIICIEGVDGLVTRNLLKNAERFDEKDNLSAGTLIWGYCRGWWPALVVSSEDLKNIGNPKKVWVFWLIDSKVSQLKRTSQVIIFCNGAKERLMTIMNKMKAFDNVFMEIMEILGNRIGCAFKEPYSVWIENYFVTLTNYKEHLKFYPYPSRVIEYLDTFRGAHSQPMKVIPPVDRKSSVKKHHQHPDKPLRRENPNHLHVKYQKIGFIVWAKIPGQIWWPAMIVDFRDCAMKEPKVEFQWVMWYGDYTLSQVNYKDFMKFDLGIKKFEDNIRDSKREVYKRGILEACKDYCTLFGCQTDNWSMNDVFNWFGQCRDSDGAIESTHRLRNHLNSENTKYSSKIQMELLNHISKSSDAAVREHKLQNSGISCAISSDSADIQKSVCIMCLEVRKGKMHEHPFFDALLCANCLIHHKSTVFAYDDDGKCFFCAICTISDTVIVCDNSECCRAYCTACLKYLIAPTSYDGILKNQLWSCILCRELSNSPIKPRADWKIKIQRMFSINRYPVSHYLQYYEKPKKRIRVLSLFDGISTGLLGLQRLGFEVEAYFASEVDPDAETVSKVHFGTTVTRLGDVRNITVEILNELLPIDLLIGGSPCNDLSLVNPKRRGLHDPRGTGILFFEYCRIKNLIAKGDDRNLFWLYENVASMPDEYKKEINTKLGCEPDLIDSAEFSPQHRPRYYWTNIPLAHYTPSGIDLQDVLIPNLNRHALVKKIRTVTTQLKSLKQGSRAMKPVIMDEAYDCLWTTELEEIFGLPRHYTDVKNLSATKRQKLIGQAWCVRTICEILKPLRNYFVLNDDPNLSI